MFFFLFFQLCVTYMDVVRFEETLSVLHLEQNYKNYVNEPQAVYKQGEQENTILQTIEKDAKRERERRVDGESSSKYHDSYAVVT